MTAVRKRSKGVFERQCVEGLSVRVRTEPLSQDDLSSTAVKGPISFLLQERPFKLRFIQTYHGAFSYHIVQL